jgi:hypothetical protein
VRRRSQGFPAVAARRRAKGLWGKLSCIPPISARLAFFVWSSKRSDWSATVSSPFTVGLLPGTHAYLGCIKPLSLPLLPRGSTHSRAALLPVRALQPMPLMLRLLLAAVRPLSRRVSQTSCVHSSAASRRLHQSASNSCSDRVLFNAAPRELACFSKTSLA